MGENTVCPVSHLPCEGTFSTFHHAALQHTAVPKQIVSAFVQQEKLVRASTLAPGHVCSKQYGPCVQLQYRMRLQGKLYLYNDKAMFEVLALKLSRQFGILIEKTFA